MASSTMPLDEIQIASPCRASWEGMAGTDRARYCRQCEKHVYNLSGMTRADAQALVNQTEGRLCVRFYRRADGTMLTQDCPVGIAAIRRRMYLAGGLAAAFVFAALSLVTAGAFALPRVGGENRNLPGPIQLVMDWLFPPSVCVMGTPVPDAPPPVPMPPLGDIALPDHD